MKLGLENIEALLKATGDPQERYPSVLVAGTNGKGSVTTYLSSILRASGMKTGTFYSPHLFRINERIRVDGEEIPSRVLDDIIGELRAHRRTAPFTFFEGVTAAAAHHFSRSGVDIAVFEVGLGGRLDATRLVNAALTVITGISLDHREHLGSTREKILMEKLGITREGAPLVASLPRAGLVERARRFCTGMKVPFIDARAGTESGLVSIGGGGMRFSLSTPRRDYGILTTKMMGKAQIGNAATAVRAAEELSGMFRGIDKRNISRGVRDAFFQGRFHVLAAKPRTIVDVSHNEEALLAAMDTLVMISPPERNVLVFGIMARKELGRFPYAALKSAREVILVPLKDGGSASVDDLRRFFKAGEAPGKGRGASRKAVVTASRGMADALRIARRSVTADDTLLILGSHVTVQEASRWL